MRSAMRGIAILFAIQAALTMAAYLDHRSRSLGEVVRVYASDQWLPNASAAVRIVAVDSASSRIVPTASLVWSLTPPLREPTPLDKMEDGFSIGHVQPSPTVDAVTVVGAVEEDGERRAVADVTIPVRDDMNWLARSETFTGPGTPRAPNINVSSEPAGIVVGEIRPTDSDGSSASQDRNDGSAEGAAEIGETTCAVDIAMAPNGGVVAVGLRNTVSIRAFDAQGPAAALHLTFTRGVDDSERRVHTDELGGASVDIVVEGVEQWHVSYLCDGVRVQRPIDIVPSWDGVLVRASKPVFSAAEQFSFGALHQRTWGDWHQDVVCDGAWLATQTTPVLDREAVLGVPGLRLAERAGGPRLCWIAGYTYLLAPDPPRSVSYFLVDSDVDAAVAALVQAASVRGDETLRAALVGVEERLPTSSAGSRRQLARWVLDSLPQPFTPIPLAVDGHVLASEAFLSARKSRGRAILAALGVDVVVVLLGLFGVLVPGMIRQRRALRSVLEDDADEGAPAVLDGRRSVAVLAVGILAVCASLLGLVVLLVVIQ